MSPPASRRALLCPVSPIQPVALTDSLSSRAKSSRRHLTRAQTPNREAVDSGREHMLRTEDGGRAVIWGVSPRSNCAQPSKIEPGRMFIELPEARMEAAMFVRPNGSWEIWVGSGSFHAMNLGGSVQEVRKFPQSGARSGEKSTD